MGTRPPPARARKGRGRRTGMDLLSSFSLLRSSATCRGRGPFQRSVLTKTSFTRARWLAWSLALGSKRKLLSRKARQSKIADGNGRQKRQQQNFRSRFPSAACCNDYCRAICHLHSTNRSAKHVCLQKSFHLYFAKKQHYCDAAVIEPDLP